MRNHLASRLASRRQMETIRYVIKPSFQSLEQKFVGLGGFLGESLGNILGKLSFTDTVTVTSFLLLKHLQTEIALRSGAFPRLFASAFPKRELLSLRFFENSGTKTAGDFIFWFIKYK